MAKRDPVPTPGGITLEMYLAFENASGVKHEFVEGRVYPMTGVHARLLDDIYRSVTLPPPKRRRVREPDPSYPDAQ